MILVYCPKISSRILYSLELLLETHLGLDWEVTSDRQVYLRHMGPRINYGGVPGGDEELFVGACGLLSERHIRPLVPQLDTSGEIPNLFPDSRGQCQMGYDPFAAAFYLVSRYEEYLPFQKDKFGRFEAREGFAFKHGFLGVPVVDHYAAHLKTALKKAFPSLQFKDREFRFIPTIDVDVAYAYRGRGGVRTLFGSLVSLSRLDFDGLWQRFRVLAGLEKDPFDTYEWQLSLHKKYGLKAVYFFLCGDYGPYDRNISHYSAAFQKLVMQISDYAIAGLHPSFASGTDPEKLAVEIRRLSNILHREIQFSRQHYLKLSLPQTYQNLIRNNIGNDFSMGFASEPGFRAGTCTPFYFYDLDKETPTNLKVFPLTVMEGTLKDYKGFGPEQATRRIRELLVEVKKCRGTFISLWHNDSLGNTGRWEGWQAVYEDMLEFGTT